MSITETVPQLIARLSEERDFFEHRLDIAKHRHEEDLAWVQRAKDAERERDELLTTLANAHDVLVAAKRERDAALAENARLTENLLDYWAQHGAADGGIGARRINAIVAQRCEAEREQHDSAISKLARVEAALTAIRGRAAEVVAQQTDYHYSGGLDWAANEVARAMREVR